MMIPRDRLARDEAAPDLVRLHRALSRLGSVLTVMNTGAHPDDEQSGLLAWLRFGRGMRVVIACSTRGEGGQNVVGPERGAALGHLRTREMEEAARVLDADVAWLGFGPDDPVHDFGFSKDGDATLARWGEARVVGRLVRAIRRHRPDVVIPTFLDVPGQHGHHRAMTRAAEAAVRLAADPSAFLDERLGPWRVGRFYLPAWSGGGGTYDDEVAPPEATVTERAAGRDPATGAHWARIGEWSRARHATQDMGRWSDEPQAAWALHRDGSSGEVRIAEDLPQTLADLAALPALEPGAEPLARAGAAAEAARAAFPRRPAIADALIRLDRALADAATALDDAEGAEPHRHRIARKRAEAQAALVAAVGLGLSARIEPPRPAPGQTARLLVRVEPPLAALEVALTASAALGEGVAAPAVALASGRTVEAAVAVAPDAPFSTPFGAGWSPLAGAIRVEGRIGGHPVVVSLAPEEPFAIAPSEPLALAPEVFLLRASDPTPDLAFRLVGGAEVAFDPPVGWRVETDGTSGRILPSERLEPDQGPVRIGALIAGRPALARHRARHPHIGEFVHDRPAALAVLPLDLALPVGARIGWVGGSSDRTGDWLRRMGLDVVDLDRIDPSTDLSALTTLVVGVVALAARADLCERIEAVHRFVEEGGTLLTLYQRPDQGWEPDRIPPRRLVVGRPSLRWRVTDPAAPVEILARDHPLLAAPNQIGPDDWAGWDKERGLYFAAEWDEAYRPLIALSDPGERPLKGALVSAEIGRGRHTHCALAIHHQMERLVPGAFRLMANLVAPVRPR